MSRSHGGAAAEATERQRRDGGPRSARGACSHSIVEGQTRWLRVAAGSFLPMQTRARPNCAGSAAGRPLAKPGVASRRSSVQQPPTVRSAQFGDRRRSTTTQSTRLPQPWHCDSAARSPRVMLLSPNRSRELARREDESSRVRRTRRTLQIGDRSSARIRGGCRSSPPWDRHRAPVRTIASITALARRLQAPDARLWRIGGLRPPRAGHLCCVGDGSRRRDLDGPRRCDWEGPATRFGVLCGS